MQRCLIDYVKRCLIRGVEIDLPQKPRPWKLFAYDRETGAQQTCINGNKAQQACKLQQIGEKKFATECNIKISITFPTDS